MRLYVEISLPCISEISFRVLRCGVVERWQMIFIFVHLNVTFRVINILLIDINMVGERRPTKEVTPHSELLAVWRCVRLWSMTSHQTKIQFPNPVLFVYEYIIRIERITIGISGVLTNPANFVCSVVFFHGDIIFPHHSCFVQFFFIFLFLRRLRVYLQNSFEFLCATVGWILPFYAGATFIRTMLCSLRHMIVFTYFVQDANKCKCHKIMYDCMMFVRDKSICCCCCCPFIGLRCCWSSLACLLFFFCLSHHIIIFSMWRYLKLVSVIFELNS